MIPPPPKSVAGLTANEVGGGAKPQDIIAAALEDVCDLPVGNRTDAHQFLSEVVNYLRRWMERRAEDDPLRRGVAAFVLSADLQNEGDAHGAAGAIKLFGTKLNFDLGGQLLLCTPSAQTVRSVALTSEDVSDAVVELTDAGLGQAPAVLFDSCEGIAYVCFAGAGAEDSSGDLPAITFDMRTPRMGVDREAIIEFLDLVHRKCLESPRDAVHVWHSREHGVAVRRAEEAIQAVLIMMADVLLDACRVVGEPQLSDSRADIMIYPLEEGQGKRTVLELKVLRAKHFKKNAAEATICRPAENIKGLIKGIDQAVDYRDQLAMDNAFLCAYDMRDEDEDTILAEVAPLAQARGVLLHRYYMYRNAEQRRQHKPGSAYLEYRKSRRRKSNH